MKERHRGPTKGKVSPFRQEEEGEKKTGVASVTAVAQLWQLPLSFANVDSAALKASAPRSRCANLHNSEV